MCGASSLRGEKLHAIVHLQVKMFKTPRVRPLWKFRCRFRSQNVQNICRKSARCWRSTFGSQNVKTLGFRTTFFGSSDLEKKWCQKSATPLARSTFGSQNVKKHRFSDHSWKFRSRKKCTPLLTRSTFGSQNVKNTGFGPLLEFRSRKSERRCGAKHISKSKMLKHWRFGPLLEAQMSFRLVGAPDWDVVKSEQNMRVLPHFDKKMAGMGQFKMICKDAFSVAGAVQKTCSAMFYFSR